LKEEALDRTMWRNRFGGGFEPVVRQNTEWMNESRTENSKCTSNVEHSTTNTHAHNTTSWEGLAVRLID
jgi:hypothetical protein